MAVNQISHLQLWASSACGHIVQIFNRMQIQWNQLCEDIKGEILTLMEKRRSHIQCDYSENLGISPTTLIRILTWWWRGG